MLLTEYVLSLLDYDKTEIDNYIATFNKGG